MPHLFLCKRKPIYARGCFCFSKQVIKQFCRRILSCFLCQNPKTVWNNDHFNFLFCLKSNTYPSFQVSSPCSFLSPYVVSLWNEIFGVPPPFLLQVYQTLGPCLGPIPALLAPSPCVPSHAHVQPTDLALGWVKVDLDRGLAPPLRVG